MAVFGTHKAVVRQPKVANFEVDDTFRKKGVGFSIPYFSSGYE